MPNICIFCAKSVFWNISFLFHFDMARFTLVLLPSAFPMTWICKGKSVTEYDIVTNTQQSTIRWLLRVLCILKSVNTFMYMNVDEYRRRALFLVENVSPFFTSCQECPFNCHLAQS